MAESKKRDKSPSTPKTLKDLTLVELKCLAFDLQKEIAMKQADLQSVIAVVNQRDSNKNTERR